MFRILCRFFCSTEATGYHVTGIQSLCGAMPRMASRHNMFDLPIPLVEVDFTICTKPMLDALEGFDKLTLRSTCPVAAESIPIRIAFLTIEIIGKARSRVIQRPDTLHVRLPMLFNTFCRLISISARSRA